MTLKSPVSYKLTLAMGICHLPLLIPRLNQVLLQLLTFQHPLKGVQGGEQKWGTLCSRKIWQGRSSNRYFQQPILWAQFLCFLISRKTPKSWWQLFLVISKSFMRLVETFWENMCLIAHTLPSQNHIYIDLPLCLLGTDTQSYLRCCLLGCSPHFAPNKT